MCFACLLKKWDGEFIQQYCLSTKNTRSSKKIERKMLYRKVKLLAVRDLTIKLHISIYDSSSQFLCVHFCVFIIIIILGRLCFVQIKKYDLWKTYKKKERRILCEVYSVFDCEQNTTKKCCIFWDQMLVLFSRWKFFLLLFWKIICHSPKIDVERYTLFPHTPFDLLSQ